MAFDPCKHLVSQILINVGRTFYPEEKDASLLAQRVMEKIGLAPLEEPVPVLRMPQRMGATGADVVGMMGNMSALARPSRIPGVLLQCPQCKQKTFVAEPLCSNCEDSQGGAYKIKYICEDRLEEKLDARGNPALDERGRPLMVLLKGCGFSQKDKEPVLKSLKERGIDTDKVFGNRAQISKEEMGMKIVVGPPDQKKGE